jgi:hypothetical protein
MLDAEIDNDNADFTDLDNIILSTIHGSKGLEFDYVIITNCIDGSFPIIGADIQEERRLFYVACTRAKKELLITSLWFDKFKPSRFIYELYEYFYDHIDFVSFSWADKNYENLKNNRQNKLSDILANLDINIYIDLKTKNILPPDEYLNFRSDQNHTPINPSNIINYSNITDLNQIFCNMINIHIYRIISELNSNNEFVYLPYIKNDPVFKQNKYSLRYSFKEYLTTSNDSQLIKHREYFSKSKSEYNIPYSKKNILKSYNVLSEPELTSMDLNNLTKHNKQLLTKSYDKFQSKTFKSIDILDDIFNLAVVNELNIGRYSLQLLLNNINYIDKIALIEHIQNITEWLEANINLAESVDYDYDIVINKYIVGKIDLIIDNRIIIIESKITSKPSINEFIKYLVYLAKYNIENQSYGQIRIIQLYNPISGQLFEWDLSEWLDSNSEGQHKLINYFIELTKSIKN